MLLLAKNISSATGQVFISQHYPSPYNYLKGVTTKDRGSFNIRLWIVVLVGLEIIAAIAVCGKNVITRVGEKIIS